MKARGTPDATALVDPYQRLTWNALDGLASRLASRLVARGLGRGDRLGLYLPNRAEMVIGFFAALKAGVIAVPINWRLQGPDLARVLDHCAPACLITTASREAVMQGDVLSTHDDAAAGSFWDALRDGDPHFRSVGCQHADIANLLYTSGTTATPKAAIHTHGMRIAVAAAMADCFRLSSQDVGLAVSPIFHTSGMSVMSNAIFVGGRLVLLDRWDLPSFLAAIAAERVTFMHLITTILVDICRAPAALFAAIPPTMRFTWGGGHNADPAMLEEFERRIGGVLLQGYSRTEGGLTYNPLDHARRRFDRHGYANRNSSEIQVFDAARGRPCAPDVTGEIVVRGDGVSPGYWDREFVRCRTPYDGGWQPTGDLGQLDADGALRFLGRSDDMIKTGGENVYPAEIAAVLVAMPEIADAVVLGVDDGRLGQRVAALVVPATPALTVAAIDQACRAALAGFKVPRTIVFAERLPRLGTEKIDIAACRTLIESGAARHSR